MECGTNTSWVMRFGAMQLYPRLVPAACNVRLWDEALRQQIYLYLGMRPLSSACRLGSSRNAQPRAKSPRRSAARRAALPSG